MNKDQKGATTYSVRKKAISHFAVLGYIYMKIITQITN